MIGNETTISMYLLGQLLKSFVVDLLNCYKKNH